MNMLDGSILSIEAASTKQMSVSRRGDPIEFIERYGALVRCLRSLAAQAYATDGIGSTQAKFLRQIGQRSRISQADLARATGTDPTLTGRALQTLIERGWVRRARSQQESPPVPARAGRGRPSGPGPGREAAGRAGRSIVGVLDPRDLEDFERITAKILAAFDAPAPPTSRDVALKRR